MPDNIKKIYIAILSKNKREIFINQYQYSIKNDIFGRLFFEVNRGHYNDQWKLWPSPLWHRKYIEYARSRKIHLRIPLN